MPVLDQTPIINYTANGSVTTFSFPFQVLNESDLQVFRNGVLTTSYTVDGIGEAGGGSITFELPPDAGTTLRLIRVTSITRDTDYVDGGTVTADSLDNDFDRIVMMVQEITSVGVLENSTGALDVQDRPIVNVGTPTAPTDAATKEYVDSLLASLNALAAFIGQYINEDGTFTPPRAIIENIIPITALDIDAQAGAIYTKTLTTPSTLTISNAISGTTFTLEITNSGGARPITFGSGFTTIKWPGSGTQPTASSGVDVYTFYTKDGSNWRATQTSFAS